MRPGWLLLVVAFPLSGCGRIRFANDCAELSQIVASGLEELRKATRPNTAAAYRTAGALYHPIAERLRKAASSSELRENAEDHARSIEALGGVVRAYADALDSKDEARIASTRGELERASRREQMASRRLGQECQGRF